MSWIELFWAEILSRDTEKIQAAFERLGDEDEKQAILNHLTRMATEEDWSEPQRLSAQYALDVLK